jgi:hypothetical protein
LRAAVTAVAEAAATKFNIHIARWTHVWPADNGLIIVGRFTLEDLSSR